MRPPLTIVALVLALPIAAVGQPKNVKKDQIPADAPAEVRGAILDLFSGKPVTRGEAALRLQKVGTPALPALPFLIDLLEDDKKLQTVFVSNTTNSQVGKGKETTVGVEAAVALIAIGNDALVPIAAALKTSSATARHNVCYAFAFKPGRATRAEQEDPRALDLILIGLSDPETNVRAQMMRRLYWLRRLNDPRVPEALRVVLGDPEPAVRDEAALTLMVTDPHSVNVLIAMLKDPSSTPDQRSAVQRWLARLAKKDLGSDPLAWEKWWAENRPQHSK